MAEGHRAWKRQGEAFWRAHHEAWKRSDLNQRQYCEVHGLPQKAFENWRQKFRAEPQSPERRLLYRRRPLSPPLSPPVSPPLSPVTYPSSQLAGPIVPRPREGHRRRFSDGDKQWILQEAAQPGASTAEVAAGTASPNAFCANGSRNWRRQRQPSSRYRSPTRMQHPAQHRPQGRPRHDAASSWGEGASGSRLHRHA